MPVYEYLCKDCEKVTEALRPMRAADDPTTCEHCGSVKTQRTQSVFAAANGERQGGAPQPMGGCGRCGDPNGPCAL